MLTPLAIARQAKEIPQWRLAQAVGVPQTVLSNIEAGRRRPNANVARRVAEIFGLEVTDLFPDVDPNGGEDD